MKPEPSADSASSAAGWHRQPIAWLALLVLLGSVAAVVFTIVVAARYPDDELPAAGTQVLPAPASRPAESAPGAAE